MTDGGWVERGMSVVGSGMVGVYVCGDEGGMQPWSGGRASEGERVNF